MKHNAKNGVKRSRERGSATEERALKFAVYLVKPIVSYLFVMTFLFSSTLKAGAKAPPLFVGFWEKDGVRKTFEYSDEKWQSSLLKIENSEKLSEVASQYASPSEWTIFFDGKTYGMLSTKPFDSYKTYKENGLQKIVSKAPQLSFRKVEKKFSDWAGDGIRPLLVSSPGNIADPNQWKPRPSKSLHPFVLKDLRKRLKGKIYFCKSASCEGNPSTRELKDTEIKLSAGYRDMKGNELQAVILNFSPNSHAYCETEGDGCHGEGPFWYLMNPAGEARFLTKAAALIETADLNRDGSSELVFWLNEYNSNGYELIDGKAHTTQKATWSYH